SNTERLNRAIGMSPPSFSLRPEEGPGGGAKGRVRRFGELHKVGLNFHWEEHPYEWVEARRMGVLREYSEGPFRWMVSVVGLEPRGLRGRTLAAVEVGRRTRRSLEQVYHRIDRALLGQAHAPAGSLGYVDPFEGPAALPRGRRRRLEALLEQLDEQGLDPT